VATHTNAIFAETSLIGTVGPFTSPNGAATVGGGPNESGVPPYSLTLVQTLTPSGTVGLDSFTVSADGNITPSPEPASMLLFGTGLLGLALAFFQRKRLGLPNGPLAES
jgi:hypothetical protein